MSLLLEGQSHLRAPSDPCLSRCSAWRVRTATFQAGGILSVAYALVKMRVKRTNKNKEKIVHGAVKEE